MNKYFSFDDKVSTIIDKYPVAIDVLVGQGLKPLANPAMRKMITPHITLKEALHHHNLDEKTIEDLLVNAIENQNK